MQKLVHVWRKWEESNKLASVGKKTQLKKAV